MRTKKRFTVIFALAAAGAVAVAGVAMAAGNSTATVAFTPTNLPTNNFQTGKLNVHTHSTYTGATQTDRAKLNFDDDFKVNVSATPKCSIGQLEGKTLAGAQAACKNALVGKGTAKATLASPQDTQACVRVYNAKDANQNAGGDQPGVLLFTRAQVPGNIDCSTNGTQGNTSVILPGALKNNPSSLPGDFTGGKQLLFKDIVATAGLPLNDFNVNAGKPAVNNAGNFIQARCHDGNHQLNLRTTFTYVNPSSTQTVNDSSACS